ncbi:MAG: cytochrome b/b6 domain-containing protein [Mucilaginibacter sp.]|uniref:cytochrome b/b6 domain-containing protein n=1 Tax=Mucilaginibacter sp. TaxID=1882438 RepID=UPI003264DB3D
MALIEPVKQKIEQPGTTKTRSANLRIWHWLNVIAISGSLITVLINSTLLKSRQQAPLVQSELAKNGAGVTLDQARAAVHVLSDKVWDIHVYFGYALVALLLFRLLAEFFELADQKFIITLKKAWQQFNNTKKAREKTRHELFVKSIYVVFYLLLLTMVLTGLCLAFEKELPFSSSMQHTIKEVHGFCMYPILLFIVIHIAGVILAERKDGKGIVSDMINGG